MKEPDRCVLIEPKRENPIHQGMHVLARLRDAGVPVVGALWPMGVESGVLVIEPADLVDGITVWRWKP